MVARPAQHDGIHPRGRPSGLPQGVGPRHRERDAGRRAQPNRRFHNAIAMALSGGIRSGMTPETPVADDEVLYRAVLNDPPFFPIDANGMRRVSSMAFNDPARRPSVDRAAFCPGGP